MRDLPTVCEQLHLPVQAGDDNLLRRMRRLYSVDEYRAKIEAAVDTVGPRLALSTDIIVGFCGETDAEFAGTESLMRELRFDTVHLAAYSVRPGTAAARREDDVPLREKKARLNHLLAMQREIAAGRNALYVGSAVEILVDGVAEDGRPYGRTRENKVAWLPAGAAAPGELHTAQVVAANAWQLQVQPVGAAA
jgi:tRNA-2-methylthio-N6-dimethylallyladenosine synthase